MLPTGLIWTFWLGQKLKAIRFAACPINPPPKRLPLKTENDKNEGKVNPNFVSI